MPRHSLQVDPNRLYNVALRGRVLGLLVDALEKIPGTINDVLEVEDQLHRAIVREKRASLQRRHDSILIEIENLESETVRVRRLEELRSELTGIKKAVEEVDRALSSDSSTSDAAR